jgi:phosphatidylinositol-3-phosphatase
MRRLAPFARVLSASGVGVLAAAMAVACSAAAPAATRPSARLVNTLFLVVLENSEYDGIIGNPQAPYLNQLAGEYTLFEQYYAIRHPSLPNYLALVGGDTFGVSSDCTDCLTNSPNLVDELEAHGLTWKSYQEDLPSQCSLESAAGGYRVWHNPFLYFRDIRNNPARCQKVVPLTQLAVDLQQAALPDFVWITPNDQHNLHNRDVVADGDRWLSGFIPPILASEAWRQNGLLIIAWDEGDTDAGCCGGAAGGHVPLLVLAPQGKPGHRSSAPATHYSLLRTIEDAWGLGHVGRSGDPAVQPLDGVLP